MKRLFSSGLFSSIVTPVLISGFFIVLAASAQAAAPIAKIQEMLAKPPVLCGRFDQAKQLMGIKKPLLSNGRFCVVSGKGVLWRTLQPFPNTLRLKRDEIVQMQGDRVAMRLDAKQEPVVRMINSVMFSLVAGDLSQLESLFDMDGSIQGSTWKVALKARQPALAKAIGTLTLTGGTTVKSVTINEASGDRTEITFSGVQSGVNAMTSEEGAALD
ncbi:outer membrane lipoprotein carrier protein LolA [Glaciimonas sp. CA11.2]|uniref:outer membrane lipoprotein carrier protein LolA n=1 Tax=Glaciimonas sp. CA11.2 TaxID=3048601 RepID=UPI002AB3A7AE|nr:outer membrane lipoprotein carrier protein LolA [Glaciimonas sp. CA11.2]MDY7547633.1 outer membrane lipoprotein carrier protein LolA [Glaciimonas sp. CA11.2]MEB0161561.1 outer membrane lipoprotein carrier protein LolA [Glaciimonas sp. CA11.2]